jgi:hypothetical protein
MFSAQLTGREKAPMGMNAAVARHNPQFLLNVMHWLVGCCEAAAGRDMPPSGQQTDGMTRRRHLLFGILALPGGGTGCASHAPPTLDPDKARIERLAGSAFGVLQTDGFSYAFATPACGPTDGPAITLYLLDAPDDAPRLMPNETAD